MIFNCRSTGMFEKGRFGEHNAIFMQLKKSYMLDKKGTTERTLYNKSDGLS